MELGALQELTHLIATPVTVLLYTIRLVILMRRRAARDRSPDPRGEIGRGILDAFLTLVMPWKMESTRRHWSYYAVFVAFHLGLLFNISLAYLVTYASGIFTPTVRSIFTIFIAIGLAAGVLRLARRIRQPEMRIISSADDYFSLFLVLLYNAAGILILQGLAWGSYAYFIIVFFFLLYEPFSKMNHYIYYPCARYFYGIDTARKGTLLAEVNRD
jgi:hypothetical protein